MNDVLLLYLFTRLDALATLFGVLAMVGAVVAGMCTLYAFIECYNEDDRKVPVRFAKLAATCAICAGVLSALTPSTRDMAIIVGAKVTLDAIRSPEAAEISSAVKDAVLKKLREAAK